MMDVIISKSFLDIEKKYIEKPDNAQIYKKIENILISDQIIDSGAKINWIIKREQKFQGIKIPSKRIIVYFTQKLENNGKPKSRNTFIGQNFNPIDKIANQENLKICISINPLDINKNPSLANFTANSIKQIITSNENVKLMNSINKLGDFKKFSNLDDFLNSRCQLRKNKGNISTLISKNSDDSITIFGKLDGANFSDTKLICKIIRQLSKQNKIYFCEIGKTCHLDRKIDFKKMLNNLNIEIINDNDQSWKLINSIELLKKYGKNAEHLRRRQDIFKRNIINKYNVEDFDISKCFASDYKISQNLIAAHIYRYVDIINDCKNGLITIQQAKNYIVSGDNGFLLSPNKDKEFEKGQIFFDLENKKFVPNKNILSQEEYNYLLKTLNDDSNFINIKFTEDFYQNISRHLSRIGILKSKI